MKQAAINTLLHTLEIIVILGGVYFITKVLGIEANSELLALPVVALVKFGREIKYDYVNK